MKNKTAGRGIGAGLLATLGIGVSACAVCCAPPLVLAIGLLGVSGATAGALLSWWLPIVGVLMILAAVTLVLLPKRKTTCTSDHAEAGACGCGPQQEPAPESRSTLGT